jgi:hypothetical protein
MRSAKSRYADAELGFAVAAFQAIWGQQQLPKSGANLPPAPPRKDLVMAMHLSARPLAAPLSAAPLRQFGKIVSDYLSANDGLRHAALISLGLASFIVVLKLSGV